MNVQKESNILEEIKGNEREVIVKVCKEQLHLMF